MHHPIVGELELSYETMTLDAHDGLRLALFTAEPGTTSQDALALLASRNWPQTWRPVLMPSKIGSTMRAAPSTMSSGGWKRGSRASARRCARVFVA